MNYFVSHNGKTIYDGKDFSEAYYAWSNADRGSAKINVPLYLMPKYEVGDEILGFKNSNWVVNKVDVGEHKDEKDITYYISNGYGKTKKISQTDVRIMRGGGIVQDYHRIKEGLIFKNEFLAMIVERFMKKTPEFWFERVGKIIYIRNTKYLDSVAVKARSILSSIEGTTDYISKMINNQPIKKYEIKVEYQNSYEIMTIMAFNENEAKGIATQRSKEKSKITGKKLKKIQILAVQKQS